ncbi:eEF1A lysine and N-terminal methyltransferase homolog [Anthophora plagiata]
MNLLPKAHEEFSQVEYWNTFFKKRGEKTFEWYGEYPELCNVFHKYIRVKDNILIVGCGNSTVSMCLYDAGYRNITNIDISYIVIKQMRDINASIRPDLIYEQMDATQMTYSDDSFSVVLDKGTLDALMPDTKEGTKSTINKYFKEITRVLRNGGRYICISLLQEHILRELVSYFPSNGFMFRIVRCYEVEVKTQIEEGSSIPVFVVIATKFMNLPQTILEVVLTDGPPPKRLSSADDIISVILSVQQSALICNSLQKRSVADIGEISLDLHRPDDKHPRYTIYVLDQPRIRGTKSYAAFIVPQGKETDWLFSTKEGRQQVLKSAERDRLAIVTLCREHKFESWDAIKNELEDCILNLAPEGLSRKNDIPFLSLGSDVGVRRTCYEGKSDLSGPFVVEEIERDGTEFRRLIFLDNPYVVQSEARLIAKSRRGKIKKIIDPGFLACDHHMYMSIGVSSAISSKECDEIMIIGLGGGNLCTFLYNCFPELKILAVEIDETMLKVATDYFGLILDNRMKVEIADGIQFIKESAANEKKYKAILFDVDSKDTTVGISCPPKQFLEMSVIKSVAKCLTYDGIYILNLVSRDQNIKKKVKSDLRSIFKSIACYSVQDEVNEVIICSVNETDSAEWKDKLQTAALILKEQVSTRRLLSNADMFDLSSFMENLSIES